MKTIGLVLFSLALAAQGAQVGKVESTFDKKANFASFHTYSWFAGYKAINPDADKAIVAAFEEQMTKLGLTKVTTGADITLAYYAVTSTEVDLKALDNVKQQERGNAAPTKTLGRVVAIVRSAATRQQIWSASTREFVDADPAKLGDTVRAATARIFQTYPTQKPAK